MKDILSISGEVLYSVPVTKDAVSHEELMTSDYVQLSWSSGKGDILPVGTHIIHNGEKYSLLENYAPIRVNDVEFKYAPQFQSRIMRWQKTIVPVYTYGEDGISVETRELDWNFTGTPADAMWMVQQAIINEIGEVWAVEVDSDLPETITISSQSSSVWSILSEIADLCETEWWANKAANYIYLGKCYRDVSVRLEVGENVKTPSITQNAEGYFTRFYAFGSTRNVTQDNGVVRGSIVNKRLTLDPKKYPGGYKDIKGHFDNGVFVSDLLPEEIFPMPLYFENVYPSSKLAISNVRKRMRYHTDDDDNKIKIGGTENTPEYSQYAIWYFQIEGLEFSEDMIVEGQELAVHFKSGQLRGREFGLTYHPKAKKVADGADVDKDFAVNEKEYEIIFDQQTEGFIIPGTDYIIPADGDEVVLYNIVMPQEYTDSAMADLESEVDKEIDRRIKDNCSYEFESNPVAFYEDKTTVVLGQRVTFVNNGNALETRVLMIEKHLDYDFEQKIRVGNEIIKGSRQQIKDEVREVGREVNRLNEQGGTSSFIQRDHTRDLMLTMGRYFAMRDTIDMLQEAVEGYTGGINPITVETMALLIGNEALQFKFTESRTDLTPIGCPLVYNAETKQLIAEPCALFHLTLGIDTITAIGVRKASDYRSWDMEEWPSEIFEDPQKKYYVYAKVEASGAVGSYATSETVIGMRDYVKEEEDGTLSGHYYLLVGILNAEYAGTRELLTLYGFTQILPGQITTDVIRSADGNTFFDLVNGIISGKVEFKAGSTGLENIAGHLNIGNQNLLRNSGFTGDYLSEPLTDETVMEAVKDLYSDPLDHWKSSQGVTVVEEASSQSGYAVKIDADGVLTQELYNKTIAGESYIVSFKAKGKGTLDVNLYDLAKVEVDSEEEYTRYEARITPTQTHYIFSAIADSEMLICEIQLERGTIATAWGMSPLDNNSDRTYWQSMKYLQQALAGSTTMAGGLILTNLIQLGDQSNQSEFRERAGANGLYFNDDDTPAFWAGGTMGQAIATIAKYKDNPAYEPTEEELANMVQFVVTHGGRAILNDAIYRGTVYSKGGFFGGRLQMPFSPIGFACEVEEGNPETTYKLTTASPSHIFFTRDYSTAKALYLPNNEAFDGWVLNVYVPPRVSTKYSSCRIIGDGIVSPTKVMKTGLFKVLTSIPADGGYMQFLNIEGDWYWLNEEESYTDSVRTIVVSSETTSSDNRYDLTGVEKLIVSDYKDSGLYCTLPEEPYDGEEINIISPFECGVVVRSTNKEIVRVRTGTEDEFVSTGSEFRGELRFFYSIHTDKWICIETLS